MSTKTKWVIDPLHSEIAFTVKHLIISNIIGLFKKFDATIYTDADDFKTAKIDFWIDSSSIDTHNADLDKDLKSAKFFDVEKFKRITFTGTLEDTDRDVDYELWGDLTIKGVTKRIKLDVEFGGFFKDTSGKDKAGFTIHGKIDRKDLGLILNSGLSRSGAMVNNDVKISCDIELQKVKEELKTETEMFLEDEFMPAVI
jgi:polyisoprenoid-binding protein YceI